MTVTQLLTLIERQQRELNAAIRTLSSRSVKHRPGIDSRARIIQDLVAAHYGFTAEQLIGPRRTDDLVIARHMAIALTAELLAAHQAQIAVWFCRTRELVPFAIESLAARRAQSRAVDATYQQIRARCAECINPAQPQLDAPALRAA